MNICITNFGGYVILVETGNLLFFACLCPGVSCNTQSLQSSIISLCRYVSSTEVLLNTYHYESNLLEGDVVYFGNWLQDYTMSYPVRQQS
jgi:hypothetical protein